MALLVPDFARAFWESVRFLLESGTTNIPLPVPWPWHVQFGSVPFKVAVNGILIGTFFVAVLAFGVVSILWLVRQKICDRAVSPSLVAASLLALPYAHFAFSRADPNHLGQGIFPILIGCLGWIAARDGKCRRLLITVLCAASAGAALPSQPGWLCGLNSVCVEAQISGEKLRIEPGTAEEVTLLRRLAERYAGKGESFIATPYWPGAYALLERRAPMWEIYALFPRSPAFEQGEIARIEAAQPRFAVLLDLPLDRRENMRVSATHPLLVRYIHEHFDRVPEFSDSPYGVYTAKETVP